MGYYTHYVGGFDITPPLPWKEVRELGPIRVDKYEDPRIDMGDLHLVFEEMEEDTDDGTTITRLPYRIEPSTDEAYKGYDITNLLSKLVGKFPKHDFSGMITCYGESSGDISRLTLTKHADRWQVVHEKAKLVWPDGTVAPLR